MNPKHIGSHKADRNELLKSPPTFEELIKNIQGIPGLTVEEKAFFGLAIGTGARATELCGVRFRDLSFKGQQGQSLKFEDITPWSYDIAQVNIIYNNLKNKKMKYKNATIIRSERFVELFEWITARYREIGPNAPDTKLYTKGRKCAYWLVKKLGDNWFPHLLRHYYVSNLIRDGVNPGIVKTAMGWAKMDNLNTYLHLSTKDLEVELKKYYGDVVPVGVPNRPLSMHQMIGAVAAKAETKEILHVSPKGQEKKWSIMKIGDKDRAIRLTKEAREVRDKIKSTMAPPIIIKKEVKVQDNDILQIV